MDMVDKLRQWGVAHAEARHAEHDMAREGAGAPADLRRRAAQLRERADRLHGEVYGELGRRGEAGRPSAS